MARMTSVRWVVSLQALSGAIGAVFPRHSRQHWSWAAWAPNRADRNPKFQKLVALPRAAACRSSHARQKKTEQFSLMDRSGSFNCPGQESVLARGTTVPIGRLNGIRDEIR
jgi:hypothetical protein